MKRDQSGAAGAVGSVRPRSRRFSPPCEDGDVNVMLLYAQHHITTARLVH
jgi:hypothetical protein